MKKLLFVSMAILVLMVCVCCNGADSKYINIDMANGAGGSISIPSGAKVRLVNLDRLSQYTVDSSSSGKGLSRDSSGTVVNNPDTGGLLEAGDNHYLTVPNRSDECLFSSEDVELGSGGEISISVIPAQTNTVDITTNDPIVSTTYLGGLEYNQWEGFCNVDFNSEFYRNLDRSKVILVRDFMSIGPGPTGTGNGIGMEYGIIYDSYGELNPDEFRGVLDLAGAENVKLYNSMTFYDTYNTRSVLYLSNPVEIGVVPKEVYTGTRALALPKIDDGKDYILKIVNPDDLYIPVGPGGVIVARDFEGNDCRQLYPAKCEEPDTSLWSIGKLDRDMLMDFHFDSSSETNHLVISIEEDYGVEPKVRPLTVRDTKDSIRIDIPAGTINEVIQIKAAEGFSADEIEIVSVLTDSEGEFPSSGTLLTGVNGEYNGAVCTDTAFGFFGRWWAPTDFNVLDLMIYGYVSEDCSLDVSIEKKDGDEHGFMSQVSICPYPGSEVTFLEIPIYSELEVPAADRDGYEFLGYLYDSEVHQPGSTVKITNYVCSLTGVWQKK